MNAVANATGFKPIVFGDPDYFRLRQVNRSGKDVDPYQTFSSQELANDLGLNGPFNNSAIR